MSLESLLSRQSHLLTTHGWYIHYVFDDAPGPINAHTHGLDAFGHPDLQVVLPLPTEVVTAFLTPLVDRVRGGETLEVGRRYPGVVRDSDVILTRASEGGRDVLRVIFPDDDGNLGREEQAEHFAIQWEGAACTPGPP